MTTARQPEPDREPGGGELDGALAAVDAARTGWSAASPAEQQEVLAACVTGLRMVAREWVAAACAAKGLTPTSSGAAEEIAGGPVAVARLLLGLRGTLAALARGELPRLPAPPQTRPDRRIEVSVIPGRGAFDRLLFRGHRARVVCGSELPLQQRPERQPAVACVLGAGNVTSIPVTDALSKLFLEGQTVLLKLSPLHAALQPILATALAPLVQRGVLRVVVADAAHDVALAARCIQDLRVGAVHLTGSQAAFRAVAGMLRQDQRLTAELGSVTPVVVLPGDWSARDLAFHAEHVATMVVNNAGCNCVAARVLVTWRDWPLRRRFLDAVEQALRRAPRRPAWHPGARERWARFAGREPPAGSELPPVLRRDVDPDAAPELLREESFVPVLAEVALDAKDERAFLFEATRCCNERIAGDLAVTLLVPPRFRKQHLLTLHVCVDVLRYGTVAINAWPALAFAWMTPPWGAAPGNTIAEPGSGLGFVHGTLLLRDPQKTVVEAPFRQRPKPVWFVSHRHAAAALWGLFEHWCRPGVLRLPGLLWHAARS